MASTPSRTPQKPAYLQSPQPNGWRFEIEQRRVQREIPRSQRIFRAVSTLVLFLFGPGILVSLSSIQTESKSLNQGLRPLMIILAIGLFIFLSKYTQRWRRPVSSRARLDLGLTELIWNGFALRDGETIAQEVSVHLPLHTLSSTDGLAAHVIPQDSRRCLVLNTDDGELRLPFLRCSAQQASQLVAYLNDAIAAATQRHGRGALEVPENLLAAQTRSQETDIS